ncbi:DNA repair protein RecO [Rodentibacter trehalosifermentans]|uniref:DNA repair protein RecO n=1 Tax=Rodentibacter trehalosifermentans TaxID=1908263 RepID=A0A1V3IYJ0_9PAST|nr:DNA repair protein RecO [Rodentibacter trehalosifermentans]OOF47091.1 DNA repair protein RecO [Rodentibacter trehalosifermentans]OOF51472.1 DNA repair protein RecO [Rodentibacter trehalosifermentans]OOF53026.1 DNA repair protein RecO [Rodentibacter trehalosifermentans]
MQIELQRGFVLHRRPYSETSLLVDLFTEESGRLMVIAKGARAKRSTWKSVLQPFTPLLLRWTGKSGLKTLTKAESAAITLPLQQTALYSGFYVNELLSRVMEPETANPPLFQHYLKCLTSLATEPNVEPCLRLFEFHLLQILGYGVDFLHCAGSGQPVDPTMTYRYREEKGFIASLVKDNLTFYGRDLIAFANLDFSDEAVRQAAKRFTRVALKPYLGDKPLKSRELFSQNSLFLK